MGVVTGYPAQYCRVAWGFWAAWLQGKNKAEQQPSVASEWLKLTGPNLLGPKSQRKRSIIKQFGRLISA